MAASEPTVVAHDVRISYRTFGGARNALEAAPTSRWSRLVGRAGKHVGAVNEIEAVKGLSFIAREGESIGLVGRNGSGKSTVLRAVAGLIPISGGQLYSRSDVALLGVNAALMKSLSGERNIMLGGLARGLTRREVREKFDEIVEFSGVGDFVKLPMSSYSSGMSARLAFAIASARTPEILIIDEALATGDAEFRRRSAERIERIREEAGTVFMVSHSATTIRNTCTRAIWLEQGQVRADGPAKEVTAEYSAFIKALRAAKKKRP
ncbi:ABC transporter ATP-binding protein [Cellulomonas bogoriensis]|uniref:Teichoic acid ABC transporter ATP-binding protein n=1 Tax=Cellulomonas bogoriensis 69B4 = DSM 16987 TaxID=1386082 RepID=A0A0A0BVL3_9CELL|nr:ABC transporter ATP-binding protein [Cellulomonas bogoriensis]KGM12020.1 teichoic acid ABC transporter ATP-binding protein [Cellulomonas bogoriensis 69B4 = DSM 16987]